MQTLSFEKYRQTVDGQPLCEGSWFNDALTRARAGEKEAGQRICDSCLRVALRAAENRWDRRDEAAFFALLEEANAALPDALASFQGDGASEFVRHVEQLVARRLNGPAL